MTRILFFCLVFCYGHILETKVENTKSDAEIAMASNGCYGCYGNGYYGSSRLPTGRNEMNIYIMYHLINTGNSCEDKDTALAIVFMTMLSNQYFGFQKNHSTNFFY